MRERKLNRRDFSMMLAAALSAPAAKAQATVKSKRKNVLLLMSDQHRPAALSLYGKPPVRTPNLDALARSGVRFAHAYCSTPVCVPSRASLLTGLWTHHHGVLNNDMAWPFDRLTLANYLGDAGYITASIGKMHFVDAQTHGFGYHLDSDDWFQYLGPKVELFADEIGEHINDACGLPEVGSMWQESGDPWAGRVVDDGRQGATALGRVSQLEERDHFESFITRESIRFLKRYRDAEEPFFLMASYLKPHGPFTPAARFFRQFDPDEMQLPETWGKVDLDRVPAEIRRSIDNDWLTPELRDPKNARLRMALYYASLLQMDENVGLLMQALKDLGLEEDTIVLYTSDHGEMLGEHGLWQKTVFYEQSAGVPLLVRVPGLTPANSVCETPVSLVSLVPTILDLCSIPLAQKVDGESLVEDLRRPHERRGSIVYSEYGLHSNNAKAMVREGKFKYTTYSHDHPDELYDLEVDHEEMNNLVLDPAFEAQAKRMKSHLDAWHTPT